jgi:(1->4)-alpha-D-glucan 1-alpha-D-glucosylmutase
VDFSLRRGALDDLVRREAEHGPLETARHLLACRRDGRIKLHLTRKALAFRRDNRELFESGRYQPLTVEALPPGACLRLPASTNGASALVVVPRFCSRLIGQARMACRWGRRSGRTPFTGEVLYSAQQEGRPSLALQDILAAYPVALLERLGQSPEAT